MGAQLAGPEWSSLLELPATVVLGPRRSAAKVRQPPTHLSAVDSTVAVEETDDRVGWIRRDGAGQVEEEGKKPDDPA